MNVKAYPLKDGGFFLVGNTFPIRNEIKTAGGVFDGNRWTISEHTLPIFAGRIVRMVRVRVAAHCHEPEQDATISEADVARGETLMGCGMCDTPIRCGQMVKILSVLEQTP